jgi:hypothetical protein
MQSHSHRGCVKGAGAAPIVGVGTVRLITESRKPLLGDSKCAVHLKYAVVTPCRVCRHIPREGDEDEEVVWGSATHLVALVVIGVAWATTPSDSAAIGA